MKFPIANTLNQFLSLIHIWREILADMGVSIATVEVLGGAAHEAVHLREQGLIRLPDSDIVAKAVQEQRVVLNV